MTGPTDINDATHTPQILIDEWEDGWVDQTAWVEVNSEVTDPATAVKWIERLYPLEDREEDEEGVYASEGETVWMYPESGEPSDETPWHECKREDPGAMCFWVVKVVCAA